MKTKITLRTQITIMVLVIVAVAVFIVFLLNTGFLESFYKNNKENNLKNVFFRLDEAASTGRLYDNDFSGEIAIIGERENLSALVVKPNGIVVATTENDPRRLSDRLFSMMLGGRGDRVFDGPNYSIIHYTDDLGGEYLVLWGTLMDGNTAIMETAVESIRESVSITNRFLIIGLIIAGAFGLLAAWFFTRRITKPLSLLTELSGRMANLEFDVKYVPGESLNEIDLLGIRMNEMSGFIEEKLTELKQKNVELLTDIRLKEKNEDMRKEFISNLSHELKTPISLILGYAEGLATPGVLSSQEKMSHYATTISKEAERMDGLIEKLLELNEINFGKEIHMARVDLSSLINEEIKGLSLILENAGVSIENTVKAPEYVWADRMLTLRVVENYLTNAIKYATNEKKVMISLKKVEKYIVEFCVFNSCPPIDESLGERIWDMFYRGDVSHKRLMDSSGIGLSIVKAAGETMGCKYGFRNVPGGVEFYFDFDQNPESNLPMS